MDSQISKPMVYEKISDDILYLAPNIVLRMNVGLWKTQNQKKEQIFFHREYGYKKNAYNTDSYRVVARRSFDYYLSIENYISPTRNRMDKAFMMISMKDLYRFKQTIRTVVSWYTDKKYENLYIHTASGLGVTEPKPMLLIENLPPKNGKIRFCPSVFKTSYSDEQAVYIELDTKENSAMMKIETLFALYDFLETLNMFSLAQNMIPNISIPLGTNRISLNGADERNINGSSVVVEETHKSNGTPGRKIGGITTVDRLEEL